MDSTDGPTPRFQATDEMECFCGQKVTILGRVVRDGAWFYELKHQDGTYSDDVPEWAVRAIIGEIV